MVFIRPTIIRDSASATEISNSRFDYLIRRDLSVDEEESTQFSESIEEIRMDSQTGQEEQEDQENQND